MKILVIDDNKEITDAISFYFDSVDISAVITNNGRDGLQMIKDRNDLSYLVGHSHARVYRAGYYKRAQER